MADDAGRLVGTGASVRQILAASDDRPTEALFEGELTLRPPGSPPESVIEGIERAALDATFGAMAAAIPERDRLADVIARAEAELGRIKVRDLELMELLLRGGGLKPAAKLTGSSLSLIQSARAILAEANLDGPEGTDG